MDSTIEWTETNFPRAQHPAIDTLVTGIARVNWIQNYLTCFSSEDAWKTVHKKDEGQLGETNI